MKRGLLFLGLALLFSSVSLAFDADAVIPVANVPGQPGLSLDEAVRRVQRETGGRILAAEAVPGPGGPIYRIKVLLPSGRVKVIQVDARR